MANNILEGKKILIVDDSKTQRINLKNILQNYNVKIFEAENGIEGLKKTFEVMPDLVISDVIMPELNGYGLSYLVTNNEYTKHIPIIILTSQDKKIDKLWGLKSGAKKFLIKGIEPDKLINHIEELFKNYSKKELDAITLKKLKKIEPQSFVLDIFDEILKKTVINEELYKLQEYIENENNFITKVFTFLDLIFDFTFAGIYKESIHEKKLFLKVNEKCSEKIKDKLREKLISITENKKIFQELKIKGINLNFLSSSEDFIPEYITEFYYNFENKYKYALIIFHKYKLKTQLIKNLLEKGFNLLFNLNRSIDTAILLSIIDVLTGAYNRRYLEDILKKEFEKFLRYNHLFSIIMMDIDHFKKINDTYGHQAGDEILKHLVQTVKNIVRKSDIIARYGGEEFCIVSYESKKDDAIYLAERLRNTIKNSVVVYKDKKIKYTVSFGVTTINKKVNNHEELLRKADAALYRAKNSGRDRVEFED